MIGTIIYIIGLVLAVKAVLEILKMPMGMVGKVISAVLVLCTSWVGQGRRIRNSTPHLASAPTLYCPIQPPFFLP